jgi:hypothetical protein
VRPNVRACQRRFSCCLLKVAIFNALSSVEIYVASNWPKNVGRNICLTSSSLPWADYQKGLYLPVHSARIPTWLRTFRPTELESLALISQWDWTVYCCAVCLPVLFSSFPAFLLLYFVSCCFSFLLSDPILLYFTFLFLLLLLLLLALFFLFYLVNFWIRLVLMQKLPEFR